MAGVDGWYESRVGSEEPPDALQPRAGRGASQGWNNFLWSAAAIHPGHCRVLSAAGGLGAELERDKVALTLMPSRIVVAGPAVAAVLYALL